MRKITNKRLNFDHTDSAQENEAHKIFRLVVCWVLWHINLCRLFNAESIFYINNQLYFKQFSLA